MTTTTTEVPVLIVGAGPAGLSTAITLAKHGVRSLVVERRTSSSTLPRATGLTTRTLEILRSWGLESRVRDGEIPVEFVGRVAPTLAAPAVADLSLGYPTKAHARTFSPTTPACVPQDHLEPVLVDWLQSSLCGEAEFGAEVASIEQDGAGVCATVRSRSGEHRLVRARYLVAADGAHSTVRSAVGIGVTGNDQLGDYATVLFRAPISGRLGGYGVGLNVLLHPQASGVLLPSGLGDRWIYAREVEPGAQGFEGQAQEQLVQLIRTATGLADLPVTIERVGRFSFAAQLAERFREGRVFLTGDAAHRVTPRGGTGLNTSVHDGYDLGWKLAWVLKGWAPDGLLDSYECEREPVGRHNVEQSADSRESARTLEESLAYDLRGRLTHVWFTEGDRRLSTLDVVGTGLTLLVGPNGSRWHAAYAGLPPLVVRTLPAEVASQLDIGMTGAVLVRPDAQPVCRWSAQPVEPEAAVRAAVEGLTTGRSAVGGAGERRAVELVSAGDAE